MDFELPEEARLLCDSVAELGRQHIEPHAASWDESWKLPPEILTVLREQGLLALRVAEEDGGAGLDAVATAGVIEELARADASVALTVAVHNLVDLPGEGLVGWGRATVLQVDRQGEEVVIDGQCGYAVLPNVASTIIVASDGVAFAVPRAIAGVSSDRDETLGMRAADLGPLRLHGVRLPASAELSSFDDTTLLVSLGAIAIGVGTSAMLRARDYALQRQQFGEPIANFQAIQWKLADFAVGLDAARLLVRTAAARHDLLAATRGAIKAAEVAIRGCSDAVQIHGGYGYTREYPVERWLRDARFCGLFANQLLAGRERLGNAIAARHS